MTNRTLLAPVGVCPDCGKRRYPSRKAAKYTARTAHPGESLNIYRCGEYYHLGHHPYLVKRGVKSRSEFA